MRRQSSLSPTSRIVLSALRCCAILSLAPAAAVAQDWTTNPNWVPLETKRSSEAKPSEKTPGTQLTDANRGLNAGTSSQGRTANFGPVGVSLEAFGTLEYTDNVRVEVNGKSGMIGTAGLRFDTSYQVTELQDLTLRGEIANRYPFYGPGERRNLFSVAPDSALRFNVWVSEVRLSAFVKFRRQLDPVLSPVVNNTAILDQRSVISGVQADLPMDKGSVQASVYHEYRNQEGDDALALATWSDVAAARVSRQIDGENKVFAEITTVRSSMAGGPAAKSSQTSIGVGDEWRPTPTTSVRASTGILFSNYTRSKIKGDDTSSQSPFARISLQQQLRENLGYQLSATRTQYEGVTSNYFRVTELSLVPNWRFTDVITFESNVSHQWLHESGKIAETARRWNYGVGIAYSLMANLDSRLNYSVATKSSDFAVRNYSQHRLIGTINYRF